MLIRSHEVFNDRSGTVIAAALTSQPQRARYPLTLELAAKGLPKRSRVKISPVRTLSVERIGKRLARVAPEELALVVEGLNQIIGPEGRYRYTSLRCPIRITITTRRRSSIE